MFNPAAPIGVPGFTPTGGTVGASVSNTLQPGVALGLAGRAPVPGSPPPVVSTGNKVNDAIRRILMKQGLDPDEIDAYIAFLEQQQEAFTAASGFQNKQLQVQIDNAKLQRKTTIDAAKLAANASRYGTDVQARTAERQMAQQAEQFRQTHGLEMAKAYTAFSQTPDMMFARNDFMSAMGNVGQGLSPAPVMSQGTPHAKTWEDFAALTGYGYNPSVQAKTMAGGGGGQASMAAGGAGGGTDERVKAANAVMKALPPSADPGHDGQDWAALNAIQSLYFGGSPQGVARLGAPRRKIAQAGLARLGYDPATVEYDYQKALPRQQSARYA